MDKQAIQVCLVDDHQLLMDGIKNLLNSTSQINVVQTFNNSLVAQKEIPVIHPDIAILDLDMPHLNGLDLALKLKAESPEIKVIILTMHLDKNTVKKIIKHNVDGFLLKNDDQEDFILGVKTVANGKKFYSTHVTEVLANENTRNIKNNNSPLKTLDLTQREKEVLTLIAEGNSSKEISEHLFISVGTVETHRKSLLKKLDVKNIAGLVRIALKEGLVQ